MARVLICDGRLMMEGPEARNGTEAIIALSEAIAVRLAM